MPIASFHTTLPDGAGAPEWVHLLPAGMFTGADGRGPFRLRDPEAVIRASMASGRLAIDENHSTDLATPRGEPSPARGWIVEMQARPDGLWGQVEWTPTGATLMTEKAYRGLSPVFERAKDGTITRVLRAALTNVPNLTLTSLNTQQDTEMDLKALRTALGLAETADEAAILAAITANATAVVRHTAQIEAIRAAAALPASLTVEGIATELQTRRAAAGNADQLAAQVQQLSTELATLRSVGAKERAVTFVDAAIKAGKPIVPLRDHYIERHTADPAGVEREINALPSINAGGVILNAGGATGGQGDDEPTAAERMTAEKMGIDPKKLAAQRKKRETEGSAV